MKSNIQPLSSTERSIHMKSKANLFCKASLCLISFALILHLILVGLGVVNYIYTKLEISIICCSIVCFITPVIICNFTKLPYEKHGPHLLGGMIAGGTLMYSIIGRDGGVFMLFPMIVAGMYYSEQMCVRTFIHLCILTIADLVFFYHIDIHVLHYYGLEWDFGVLFANYIIPELVYLTIVFIFSMYNIKNGRSLLDILVKNAEVDAKRNAEIETCSEVQKSALPSDFEIAPNNEFSISAGLESALETAGDFYDMFITKDNHLVMLIADVSDKGLASALYMMSVRNTVRSLYSKPVSDPKEVFDTTNNILCDTSDKEYVTMFLLDLDINTGYGKYVNAGHNPPFIVHEDNTYESLEYEPQVFMGSFKDVSYSSQDIKLNKGDLLTLYTDGITDTLNENSEEYGVQRIIDVVRANSSHTVNEVKESILDDVRSFADNTKFVDDRTISLLKWNQ